MWSTMFKSCRKDCPIQVGFAFLSYIYVFRSLGSEKYSSNSNHAHVKIPLARREI